MRVRRIASKRSENVSFEIVAIKEIVGIERNQPAIVWMDDVHTRFLHRTHIECVRIDELHDEDAEDVFVAETVGRR